MQDHDLHQAKKDQSVINGWGRRLELLTFSNVSSGKLQKLGRYFFGSSPIIMI